MNKNFDLTTIRILEANEVDAFIDLIRLFEKEFEMQGFQLPDYGHIRRVLDNKNFTVVVAEIQQQIVGGATIYTLDQYYSTKPLAYIYDLAVRQDCQRQGIGKKIIQQITGYFQANGYEEVFVQADEIDDYALDFYRSTSLKIEEKVRHFYYVCKSPNETI
jgi:aminoglycoside 3-N-acetyltransferase I